MHVVYTSIVSCSVNGSVIICFVGMCYISTSFFPLFMKWCSISLCLALQWNSESLEYAIVVMLLLLTNFDACETTFRLYNKHCCAAKGFSMLSLHPHNSGYDSSHPVSILNFTTCAMSHQTPNTRHVSCAASHCVLSMGCCNLRCVLSLAKCKLL